MTDSSNAYADAHEPMARGALGAWWWQGARSAFLFKPDWAGLQTTPGIIACLVLVPQMLGVLVERLYIEGAASFYWPTLQMGWLSTAIAIWVCWLLVPRSRDDIAHRPASAAALFAMMAAQVLTISTVLALVFVPMVRGGAFSPAVLGRWGWWTVWLLAVGWVAVAQLALVWRSSTGRIAPKALATALLVGTIALSHWFAPTHHWYPSAPQSAEASAEARTEPFKLTQELIELQPQLLAAKLKGIGRGRPGVVNLFAITFAPYAEEDVFRRESKLVAGVMEDRFDAAGQSIQLVNHRDTVREWPWATPLNLQRAIQRVGQVMNRDEDVIFIHLTSHGARDGALSAEFWPLSVDTVTPQMLKTWLDDAGIRYRVISVSACYSGSWIQPLSDTGTLVMTAADSDHTSYGCGKRSELTYFGRAMFDEQLRHTWSFERAHAAARSIIAQREREAGKSDGYSNPQIHVGAQIRDRLARLEAQREAAAAR
jgi:hypothetical protein